MGKLEDKMGEIPTLKLSGHKDNSGPSTNQLYQSHISTCKTSVHPILSTDTLSLFSPCLSCIFCLIRFGSYSQYNSHSFFTPSYQCITIGYGQFKAAFFPFPVSMSYIFSTHPMHIIPIVTPITWTAFKFLVKGHHK